MTPKQIKCIGLMVSTDMTQKEIAKEIKVSEQSICAWKKDPEFMALHDKMLNTVIRSVASQAFRTLLKLLDADSEGVRFNAAKYIMELAGHKPKEDINITGTVSNPLAGLSTEDLKKLVNDD